jgi:ABC-type uncharacterized transport system permease subunit
VIIPLFLIVVYAFTDDSGHLTLANFQKFFEHPEAINTFVYSIGIAIITTLVCILLGYPAAWILSNSKLNPMYWYITGFRRTLMWGIPLDINMFLVCGLCALISMLVGVQMFRKTQDRFVLHI